MPFVESQGVQIYYDGRGTGEPVLLFLPGWCVHHTIYTPVLERLSASHRVLTTDWRGHGQSHASNRDFGYAEMVEDVLAVIEASGADTLIPVSQAHGGWVSLELLRRLGERVPKAIFVSWNPIITSGNPIAAPILQGVAALQTRGMWDGLQDPTRGKQTVENLVSTWVRDAPPSVSSQIWNETETHGYEDWARGGREITAKFAREGDPLQALSRLSPQVSVLHIYAQPRIPEFLAAQEAFAREYPWFSVRRLDAVSHFPTLEVPDQTAQVISDFIG
jgi:pimeloyl-ACP methyl ester carboxylesterase